MVNVTFCPRGLLLGDSLVRTSLCPLHRSRYGKEKKAAQSLLKFGFPSVTKCCRLPSLNPHRLWQRGRASCCISSFQREREREQWYMAFNALLLSPKKNCPFLDSCYILLPNYFPKHKLYFIVTWTCECDTKGRWTSSFSFKKMEFFLKKRE